MKHILLLIYVCICGGAEVASRLINEFIYLTRTPPAAMLDKLTHFSCLLDKSPHLANRNKSVIVCVQVYAFITNFLGLRLHTIQFSKSILYI